MNEIVKKIDEIRVKKGWSVYKLASEAMLSHNSIHLWLQSKNEPNTKALQQICDALEIDIVDVVSKNTTFSLEENQKKLYTKWLMLDNGGKEIVRKMINSFLQK